MPRSQYPNAAIAAMIGAGETFALKSVHRQSGLARSRAPEHRRKRRRLLSNRHNFALKIFNDEVRAI